MKTNHVSKRIFLLSTVLLVALLAFSGCGNEDSITGVTPDGASMVELVADPLDGVLDATEGYTPAEAGPRIDRLAEALGLTEEQKQALIDAYAEFRASLADLREQVRSGDLTVEEARAQAEVLRQALEADLQLILTPEQYDLLQEMRSGHDGRVRPVRDRVSRWAEWLQAIDADEAQVAAIREALEVLHTGIRELRMDVRAGEITGDAARDAAMVLREEFDAALQEILTPEQYELLMELRPDCGEGSGNRDHQGHDDDQGQGGHDDQGQGGDGQGGNDDQGQGGDDDHGQGGNDDQGQGGDGGNGGGNGGQGNQ